MVVAGKVELDVFAEYRGEEKFCYDGRDNGHCDGGYDGTTYYPAEVGVAAGEFS